MTRYRTIVADPPWDYPEGFARSVPTGRSLNVKRDGDKALPGKFKRKELPYPAMSVNEICELRRGVRDLVDPAGTRLFLWTTNKYLEDAFLVCEAWDFQYRQMLVWHKADGGPFITSVAPNTAEFVLVATRGNPERIGSFPSQVFKFPAVRNHSTKPEGFLDLVEQTSPGPYLEMFSRRNRLGWDTYGNEALNHVELAS